MRRLKLILALGGAALLALSGIAMAKDRHGDDHGHHGHHGRHHHNRHDFSLREAGTISSFDSTTGKLTIALTSGEAFTGLVTDETKIKCEGVDDGLARRDHGGDNSGSGGGDNGGQVEPGDDNGGRGEPEPGDDHGGQNEPGDDNGGEAPAGAPTCSTASLTVGEIVGEAELRLEGGTAVFEEVELGFHS
jgi:hypothetical protein